MALTVGLVACLCLCSKLSSRWTEPFVYLLIINLLTVAITAGRTLPSPWWAIAFPLILLAFILPGWLTYILGIAPSADDTDEDYDSISPRSSAAKPRPIPGLPDATPEGAPIRSECSWPGDRGEPQTASCLMPDGVYLVELDLNCCFSDDGRYFIAKSERRLLVLDREKRRLYRGHNRCPQDHILSCDEQQLHFLDASIDLAEVFEKSAVIDLVAVVDLWVEPRYLNDSQQIILSLPAGPGGQHREAHLYLPPSLRALDSPLAPLWGPRYQLHLDGKPSGIALTDSVSIYSAESSATLVCLGWPLAKIWRLRGEPWSDQSASYWWWRQKLGWQRLTPTLPEASRLGIYWKDVVLIDDDKLWIEACLDIPTPDCGRYGTGLSSICSAEIETQRGHDEFGRSQSAELHACRFEVLWPPPVQGLQIRSVPLPGGGRLELAEQSRDGAQVAYMLILEGRCIPGLWQLEFKISEDGKHVALLPACADTALSEKVVVLELATGRLSESPPMLVERLRDFADGILEVVELSGLCSAEFTPHSLQPADLPAPPANRAAEYYVNRGYHRAGHCLRQLQVSSAGLEPMPEWRLVDRPQSANADASFILPAPNGRDAAWLRGTKTEYAGTWTRHEQPRLGGYLLTASGCALFNVTPSFAWSTDGRYLALTHLILQNDPANDDPQHAPQWQLWLLDTQVRSLRIRPGSIGRMPRFEAFHDDAWSLRTYKFGWEVAKDRGRVARISLQELLQLPELPLRHDGGLWHYSHDQRPATHWQAFDKMTLAPWRFHASDTPDDSSIQS